MTKEQIAEFRHLAEYEECLLDLCFAMVPLIDEREALLTALAAIVERLDGDREFVIPDGGAEMLIAARAAIAKAEAPYLLPPKTVFVSSRPGSE